MQLKDIKVWDVEVERKITTEWKKSELFNFNPEAEKIYSIDTPPPYINSPIHMGHAVTYCFMDMIARFKRMKGFEVLFPLGLDRNGLPIEVGAEKKYGVSPSEVGRERFIEYCERLLNETSAESIDSFARLGISFSSYSEGEQIGSVYNTDSPEYRALTQKTFLELYRKGLIYEDTRINNWDSELQTTIADSEIEYRNITSTFNDIRWKVKEDGSEIVIGTTRPELICTCGMVIFNPEDERYQHLEGKTAVSPLFGTEVPIRAHPLADREKGTGIVMMCSAGDLSDIQFFREMDLSPKIAISKDGTMNGNAGFLEGLKVKDAREKIIEKLKSGGLLVRQEQISHRTPVSERSGAEIEFIEMPEFYLRQVDFKDDIRKIAKKINFYPEESRRILEDWINSVSIDWPISRRRYYATEVPLWSSDSGKYVAVPLGGDYYRPWMQCPPDSAEVLDKVTKKVLGKVRNFSKEKWVGEIRVLDTWMDSSISELNMIKYGSDDDFFRKAYPVSLRPQGKEIVRTWLYYTLLRGFLETGKPCFKDVWIHQHILDEKGRKMSKSLGNVINPQDILNDEGAEALRLWSAVEGDLSKGDFICSREKIRAEKKTLNKLLNVSRFVSLFGKPKFNRKMLVLLDKLFVDYVEGMTKRIEKSYEKYDFNHPAQELRHFLWEIFASHYVEMIKSRAYNGEGNFSENESDSAKWTLHFINERILVLLYPIIPQATSVIATGNGFDLLTAKWPKVKEGNSDVSFVSKIMEFNSLVWKTKKDRGISLKEKIDGISIPKGLKGFERDLRMTHRIN